MVERFFVAVTGTMRGATVGPELLPMVLAQAAVSVLPVEGAGLSLIKDLRVPIGASDEIVARAEALQTTLGEGPCLTAAALEQPLVADHATMAARWPIFHQEFIAQTPYRSVASVPLRPDAGPSVERWTCTRPDPRPWTPSSSTSSPSASPTRSRRCSSPALRWRTRPMS